MELAGFVKETFKLPYEPENDVIAGLLIKPEFVDFLISSDTEAYKVFYEIFDKESNAKSTPKAYHLTVGLPHHINKGTSLYNKIKAIETVTAPIVIDYNASYEVNLQEQVEATVFAELEDRLALTKQMSAYIYKSVLTNEANELINTLRVEKATIDVHVNVEGAEDRVKVALSYSQLRGYLLSLVGSEYESDDLTEYQFKMLTTLNNESIQRLRVGAPENPTASMMLELIAKNLENVYPQMHLLTELKRALSLKSSNMVKQVGTLMYAERAKHKAKFLI